MPSNYDRVREWFWNSRGAKSFSVLTIASIVLIIVTLPFLLFTGLKTCWWAHAIIVGWGLGICCGYFIYSEAAQRAQGFSIGVMGGLGFDSIISGFKNGDIRPPAEAAANRIGGIVVISHEHDSVIPTSMTQVFSRG